MPSKPKHNRPKHPPRQQVRYDPQRGSKPPEMIDLVEAGWLLKAVGGTVAAALLCVYIMICFLFSHSQWQLVLHPKHTVVAAPSSVGLNFTEVHFGVDDSGQPQLDGWWIPGNSPTPNGPAIPTALLLHNGDGTISDTLPTARTLHNAHLNVLLFDYRGYGHSNGPHPTEASMDADADTALAYLTATRSIPDSSIVVYGDGVGGSLAVRLCTEHHDLPALILQSPDGDFEARIRQDPRIKLVPVSLLFNQKFPLAAPLHDLSTPKLLISTGGTASAALQYAANPKTIVELHPNDDATLAQALSRFLSTYANTGPHP